MVGYLPQQTADASPCVRYHLLLYTYSYNSYIPCSSRYNSSTNVMCKVRKYVQNMCKIHCQESKSAYHISYRVVVSHISPDRCLYITWYRSCISYIISHFSHILLKWPIYRDVIRYDTLKHHMISYTGQKNMTKYYGDIISYRGVYIG